jgi:hypothetical protein
MSKDLFISSEVSVHMKSFEFHDVLEMFVEGAANEEERKSLAEIVRPGFEWGIDYVTLEDVDSATFKRMLDIVTRRYSELAAAREVSAHGDARRWIFAKVLEAMRSDPRVASDAEFGPRASEAQIAAVESRMRVKIPKALRSLLKEADGVIADYGSDMIWSLEKIETENTKFRSFKGFRDLYMPFTSLLFIGADGGGDQFAYPIHADGLIHKHDVFRWEHESDARSWFAGDLESYILKRLSDSDDE